MTDKYYPGYGPFCQYLTANNDGRAYYYPWAERRDKVLATGVETHSLGWGHNHIAFPLVGDQP